MSCKGFSGIFTPADGSRPKFGVGEIVRTSDGKVVTIQQYYCNGPATFRYQCSDGAQRDERSLSPVEGSFRPPSAWPQDADLRLDMTYYKGDLRIEYPPVSEAEMLRRQVAALEDQIAFTKALYERQRCQHCGR